MSVWLIDTTTESFVEASLVPITGDYVDHAAAAWVKEFQRRQRCSIYDEDYIVWTQGVMSGSSSIEGDPHKGYVVVCCSEIQGVVVFDEQLQPSRRRPGTKLLYVKYLATAPWNRRHADANGRFRQVGRILVAECVRESITLGCPGRIGLHSFPSASQFYDKLRFDSLGSDAARRGLNYFELSTGVAHGLLSEYGKNPGFLIENS